MKSRKHAFTLIEMLVVIAIIALLTAIIIPSVNKAIGRSRTIATAANMRSIGQGFVMYSLENNFKFPVRYAYSATVHGRNMHWQEQVQPYLGKDSANENWVFDYQKNPVFKSRNADDIGGNHFGLNKFMFEDQPQWVYRSDIIPRPSGTVIVGEINQNSSEYDPELEPSYEPDVTTKHRISNPGKTVLLLFADGHVETRKDWQRIEDHPKLYKWW